MPSVRPTVEGADNMRDPERELRLEGIVHASRFDLAAQGKQFVGAAVECDDGKV